MYLRPTARLAIYAQGQFGKGHSKTAEGVIRYADNPIAAVIDSSESGKTVKSVVGIDCPAPIVPSVEAALEHKPDALLLGTAWIGGELPPAWRNDIITALKGGMDVVNGLHDFLADDHEIAKVAADCKKRLLDVRRPPEKLAVGSGKARNIKAFTVLTVGTDCSVGKMTASLEIEKEARKRGIKAKFVPTGQTGIMIAGGWGIAIDRVIGDFMAGAAEQLVLEAAQDSDLILVEGQGSLAHPGFSGVTLSLMHGSCPRALILCHKSTKSCISEMEEFPLPDLKGIIEISESMSQFLAPAKVVAVALNTYGMQESEARRAVESAASYTGLPATDPVRFGAGKLLDAIVAHREKQK